MQKALIKKISKLLILIFCLQPMSPILAAVITLPGGTTVQCELKETISGTNYYVGQRIRMVVANDVKKNGETVIQGGSDVLAEVVTAVKPKALGKPGEIGIVIKSTTAVDGSTISLSASKVNKGEDKSTMSVVIGLFLCIFALFMTGGDATLQAGSIIDANTVTEYDITT